MHEAQHQAQSLHVIEGLDGDVCFADATSLIAAGIIVTTQIPGRPGMPLTSASFVDGVLQPRGSRVEHGERWMQVTTYGKKLRVTFGIPRAERERRQAAHLAKREAERQAAGIPAIGCRAAEKQFDELSASFRVGAAVIVGGRSAIVTEGYCTQSVRAAAGPYLDREGNRIVYRRGYVCQYPDGKEFFWPAHEVHDAAGKRSHLRLVHSAASTTAASCDHPTTAWPVKPWGVIRSEAP